MDGNKLSLTNLGMWIMLGIMIHIAIVSPDNVAAVMGATAGFIVNTWNYVHKRRHRADSSDTTTS